MFAFIYAITQLQKNPTLFTIIYKLYHIVSDVQSNSTRNADVMFVMVMYKDRGIKLLRTFTEIIV